MKDKLKIFGILVVMIGGIYFIATGLRNKRLENIDFIKTDYQTTKGIVTKISTYKGHSIHVKYKVGKYHYISSDGFDIENKIMVGDTIMVKYSTTKPELMITEFNEQF